MYQRLPSWVLGFHGTDEETVQKILNDPKSHLDKSANEYDWLGKGIYFWENDPDRALEFTVERLKWKKITDKKPAVIGAVIDLGLCLNLFDQPALLEIKDAFKVLRDDLKVLGLKVPENENSGENKDKLYRYRDKAVISRLHLLRAQAALPPYDTVRSGFQEGKPAYPGAGFRSKNHIQISVCDPKFIKGYFLPRKV